MVRAPAASVGGAIDTVGATIGCAATIEYGADGMGSTSVVVETLSVGAPTGGFATPLSVSVTAAVAAIDFPKPTEHVTVVTLAPPHEPTSFPPTTIDESL